MASRFVAFLLTMYILSFLLFCTVAVLGNYMLLSVIWI